jgi:hypothetical protein
MPHTGAARQAGAEECLQGWQVMQGQLQGQTGDHDDAERPVRQQAHLPDGPCLTPCPKGA